MKTTYVSIINIDNPDATEVKSQYVRDIDRLVSNGCQRDEARAWAKFWLSRRDGHEK